MDPGRKATASRNHPSETKGIEPNMKVALVYLDQGLTRSGLSVRHVVADPLGIRYLSAALMKAGHEVTVLLQGNMSVEEIAGKIQTQMPRVLGLSCLTFNTPTSQRLAHLMKVWDRSVLVVAGGEHPSLSPQTTFTSNIDYVVKGEGENTFLDLLRTIEENGNPHDVPGLYYMGKKGARYTGDRKPADINLLPWPARDPKVVSASRMNSFFFPAPSSQTGLVTMLASRGCSFACNYCSSRKLWNNQVRFRSVTDVCAEIESVTSQYGANVVVFYDLTFNMNPRFVESLCVEFVRRDFAKRLSFYSTCRVSAPNGKLIMTPDILARMKQAGFVKIGLGIESTNDDIAAEYKAGCSPWKNTSQAITCAHELGILVRLFIMLGGPSETPQTYAETKKRLDELPAHDLRVGYATPLPGTDLDARVPPNQRFTTNLADYDCEHPIIRSPYFSHAELVAMQKDILRGFHCSPYRESVVADAVRREPRLAEALDWRREDLVAKGFQC